jgi:hypothetical protein
MPTENYSHMVMENKHMVGGYGVDDDGGEEALDRNPPLYGVPGLPIQNTRYAYNS